MRVIPFLVIPLVFAASDPDDPLCSAEPASQQYACECWTDSSYGLTVGDPEPCAEDLDEAVDLAVEECSDEVGETCMCECGTGGKSCG